MKLGLVKGTRLRLTETSLLEKYVFDTQKLHVHKLVISVCERIDI